MTQPDYPEPSKRAVIYTMSYLFKQVGATNSIQGQIERCRAYCAERGYTLPEDQTYYEIGEGTVDTNRPELMRLIKAVQKGIIEVLVIVGF